MAVVGKAELIKLQKSLKTDAAIAKKFKVTRQAIHSLRKKYGIESNLATNPERNAKIIALYKAGKPGTKIAKKFDLSIAQAYRIIKENSGKKQKTAKKSKK